MSFIREVHKCDICFTEFSRTPQTTTGLIIIGLYEKQSPKEATHQNLGEFEMCMDCRDKLRWKADYGNNAIRRVTEGLAKLIL